MRLTTSALFGLTASLALAVATGGCGDDPGPGSRDAGGDAATGSPDVQAPDLAPEAAPVDATSPDTAASPDASSAYMRLIDDFESGNVNGIGREFPLLYSWSTSANLVGGFGKIALPGGIEALQSPRPGSQRGFHMVGGPFEDGGDLFVDFHPVPRPGTSFSHVDFSAFSGIAFWALAAGPDYPIYVALKDGNLAGQRFTFWEAELVHDDPWPSQSVRVTDRWQRYVLLFEDFRRGVNVDRGRHLDTTAINSIHFIAGTGGGAIDLWIDDVALLCRGPCPPL